MNRFTDEKVNILADNMLLVVSKLILLLLVSLSIDIIGNYIESINPNPSPIHTVVDNVIDTSIFSSLLRFSVYLAIPVGVGVMAVLIRSSLISQTRRILWRFIGVFIHNFITSILIITLAYAMFWV